MRKASSGAEGVACGDSGKSLKRSLLKACALALLKALLVDPGTHVQRTALPGHGRACDHNSMMLFPRQVTAGHAGSTAGSADQMPGCNTIVIIINNN